MGETVIPLPLPTNHTQVGPCITHKGNTLTIKYDYENDQGIILWGEVVFEELLYFMFCDISCCHPSDIVSSNHIRKQEKTELLMSVLSRWSETVGWQEWQQKQGGQDRFRHFTIFFDDVGAINVIASKCSVQSR